MVGLADILGSNAIANFLIGWQWVLRHYYLGYMVGIDSSTKKTTI